MGLPEPGEIFDNYKVLKVLGEGGMGQVFLAEDIKLSRKVALKFLASNAQALDSQTIIRFENEAKILAALNHPNIVNIYTFGTYAGISYLAMEYVPGVTMTQVIEKRSLGVLDSINVIKQVITGLKETHKKGILHRDIKPANILIGEENSVKIVDFGISKSLVEDDQNLTKDNHFIGTISYMAPELLRGHPPSPASDLFSVGIVLYELLVGRNPFSCANKIDTIDNIRNTQAQLPDELKSIVPDEVETFLYKMTALDPNQRFQSANEALDNINKLMNVELPDFLGVSLRPELIVLNKQQIRLNLLQKGYQDSEIDIIVKISANLTELKESSQHMEGDHTVDVHSIKPSNSILIEDDTLIKAVKEFENSKSRAFNTAAGKTQQPTLSMPHPIPSGTTTHSTNERKIPFPLFNPLTAVKYFIIFGFILFNIIIISKGLKLVGVNSTQLDNLIGLFLDSEEKNDNVAEIESGLQVDDAMETTPQRNTSSVPVGTKSLLPVGSLVRFSVSKIDLKTGAYLTKKTYELSVHKNKVQSAIGYFREGTEKQRSVQSISSNALLPPLRWFKKGKFDIENKVTGDHDKIYPIKVGSKANFSVKTLRGGGVVGTEEQSCRVLRSSQLVFQGQTRKVLIIVCSSKGEGFKRKIHQHYWPEKNIVLKKVTTETSPKGKTEETMKVISLEY